MDRREFLKVMGGGTVATAAVLTGCKQAPTATAEGFAQGEVPTDKMTYRTGKHGEKISLLGYGCMRMPTIEGNSGRENNFELDQEQINRLTDYAIEHGVTLFDTAPPYCKGRSEHAMGIALSRHPRDKYYLSSKMSNFPPNTWSREESIKIYHNTLKELQIDYIDFMMLHAIGGTSKDLSGRELSPMEVFEARFINNGILDFLMEEREKGRIRNLGFSYHGDVKVFDRALDMDDTVHWDHVLIQHNYVDWHHEAVEQGGDADSEYMYNRLAEKDIPIFVMEPLLGGTLATLNDAATKQLKQKDPQASIASWAFRFAGSQPRILTVLSGMTYMEHLQDNIRTYSPLKPLNDDEYAMLESIAHQLSNFPTVPCTGCQYCMPCPYGIDIPGIFSHYNKCVNEGNVALADDADADKKAYRKARRAFLVGYDHKVPRLRQADHCISCGACVHKCPQKIDIPAQMKRINGYVEELS
ncbi:MAG: aldo/keto reductase [Bacteroidales bacterium]|nr:aldo/keto reductase [Bacteroidales bacterium]